jgi:hypothetical protein
MDAERRWLHELISNENVKTVSHYEFQLVALVVAMAVLNICKLSLFD